MLSDPEHKMIEATGILNELVYADAEPEMHLAKVAPNPTEMVEKIMGDSLYGMSYPGSFVLGRDGRIEEKLFYQHYRTRPSVATVLRSGFGVDFEVRDNPHAEARGEGVRILATFGGESVIYMETAKIYVDIDLDPGMHIYGDPTPPGFTATQVTVTGPDWVDVFPVEYPATRPFRVESIDREFQVLEGPVCIAVPIQYTLEDPDHLLGRVKTVMKQTEGAVHDVLQQVAMHMMLTRSEERPRFRLQVRVDYQACTDQVCHAPRSELLELEVPVEAISVPNFADRL